MKLTEDQLKKMLMLAKMFKLEEEMTATMRELTSGTEQITLSPITRKFRKEKPELVTSILKMLEKVERIGE